MLIGGQGRAIEVEALNKGKKRGGE